MSTLPVAQVIPDLKLALHSNSRLVLQAPPGAGKTTLLPLALLEEPWLQNRLIIMLEPRRLAARNAATRMAFLLGEPVGQTIGYRIRAEHCVSARTRILVVTEGILTRMLQTDPALADTALVIFDEFHERNLHADLSLAFCLQSQQLLRPELRILVMSATLDTERVAQMLNEAPVITSEGRSYPVANIYLVDNAAAPNPARIADSVMRQLEKSLDTESGNVLVFLPGVREIIQLEGKLRDRAGASQDKLIIAPLYGDLSREQQDKAIQPCAAGVRKIVLATNIAETSLTIEGVSIVIDSGLQREARFNPGAGMDRIDTVSIAQDSADQRSGRAGRLQPGTCYRLWSETQHRRLARHATAEILRSDLAPMMLELAHWGVREVSELRWLDTPNAGAVAQARELLRELGAIDAQHAITAHGKQLLDAGAHPRLAHMMICGAQAGHAFDACLLAALLSERDIFQRETVRCADIATRLTEMRNFKMSASQQPNAGVNHAQCRVVMHTAEDFFRRVKRYSTSGNPASIADHDLPGVLLAYAYPDRIARSRHTADLRYLMSNGKGAILDQGEALAAAEYIVIADLDAQQRESRVYRAAEISLPQLETRCAELIRINTRVSWNAQTQRVDAVTQTRLGAIVLQERSADNIEAGALHAALLEGIRLAGIDCLPWDKQARSLQQRAEFLRKQQHGELSDAQLATLELHDLSDASLLRELEHWLLPHLDTHNSLKKLQSLNLHAILQGMLSWSQQQTLDSLAPTHITVPSGSRIAIDYSDPQSPVLAVRLQELFGLEQTPAVINGHCKLLLHLLSPAYKPMQVTQDLASFWRSAYFEVRKELRGRYKKHYWPENPLQAQATSRAKRRGDTTQ
jgi:ATP-dependent helicase HrpB